MMKRLFLLLLALIWSSGVYAATNKTAEWDAHPQAAQLTAIELEWWTSADPTPVAQSVPGSETRATMSVNGDIADTVFVRARACKDATCSDWAGPVSGLILPDKIMRLRFVVEGVIEITPEPTQ